MGLREMFAAVGKERVAEWVRVYVSSPSIIYSRLITGLNRPQSHSGLELINKGGSFKRPISENVL